MFVIPYPMIDPVLLPIWGPIAIRWYGLAYVAGFFGGYFYIQHLKDQLHLPLSKATLDELMSRLVIGIIIGGRLGFMVLYDLPTLWQTPWQLFKLWDGGMSFHGGLLGGALAVLSASSTVPKLRLLDVFAPAIPLGLFFGRLANFINGELYGRVSDVPWAMVFPYGGPLPRHPSQLYEAFTEGVLLGLILWRLAYHSPRAQRPGFLTGIYLIGYSIARMSIEYYREPEVLAHVLPLWLTWGQILCLPMVLIGTWLLRKPQTENLTS